MSIKVMNAVWDLTRAQIGRDEKYVLLAYADHAHDDGSNVYPAIKTIAAKTLYDERTIQRITRRLAEDGFLLPVSGQQGGRGVSAHWQIPIADNCITPGKGDKMSPFVKGDKMPPIGKRVTKSTQKGDIAMSPEPSEEPSLRSVAKATDSEPILDPISLDPDPAQLKEPAKKKKNGRLSKERSSNGKTGSALPPWPEAATPFLDRFIERMGLDPAAVSESTKRFWVLGRKKDTEKPIYGLIDFVRAGFTLEEMDAAFVQTEQQRLTISQPNSIYAMAVTIHRRAHPPAVKQAKEITDGTNQEVSKPLPERIPITDEERKRRWEEARKKNQWRKDRTARRFGHG